MLTLKMFYKLGSNWTLPVLLIMFRGFLFSPKEAQYPIMYGAYLLCGLALILGILGTASLNGWQGHSPPCPVYSGSTKDVALDMKMN